jgi:hypothetical protein
MILTNIQQDDWLVPLPYLLSLASFNFDVKNSEASKLLAEGDASRKQIKLKVASEQETLVCLSYQFVCDFVKQFTFVINET